MQETQEDDITRLERMQESYSEDHSKAVYSVYVKNLDTSVTNSDIAMHFKSCGHISGVNVVNGKNLRRYAVINFSSQRSVEICLHLNGSVLKGKKMVIQKKINFNKP